MSPDMFAGILFGIGICALAAATWFAFMASRIKLDEPPIEIGRTYRIKNGNPWGNEEVVVLEVKDGWVRYKWTDCTRPSELQVNEFRLIYS